MTTIESKLKELKTLRLPEERKLRMREELLAYAELHAVAPAPAARAFSRFHFRIYSALAAVLIIIIGLGGTAYASEDALPGDTLYSVKVSIAEPLQTALVPGEKGKAAWHAILAERRLEEAAQLAAKEKLTPDTQEKLAANFTDQVKATDANADRLERAGDAIGSLSVRSDLDARLTAHEQILSIIAAHYATATSSSAASTKEAVSSLLALVKTHEEQVSASRHALELAIAPTATSSAVDADSSGSSDAVASAKATSTEHVAIATEVHTFAPATEAHLMRAVMSPEPSAASVQVASQNASQAKEVDAILTKHAPFLAMFLPLGSTTASTTIQASTTASTTIEVSTSTVASTTTSTSTSTLDVLKEILK